MLLFLRSLLWTILLPGVVAGYVPWQFFGLDRALHEEPALRRQFGESYDAYCRDVGRWLPRLRPR